MKNKILSVIFITFIIVVHAKIPIGNKQPDNKKPNIIFIAVDDMNDWVGYLGGHGGMKIHTPNIDRLAKASMIFTNAHTPSPCLCSCSCSHTFWSTSYKIGNSKYTLGGRSKMERISWIGKC